MTARSPFALSTPQPRERAPTEKEYRMTAKRTPIETRSLNGGTQELYRFPNGYGASLIRGGFMAYGGLEIGVMRYHGEGARDCRLIYSTPVTNDVLGNLSEDDLDPILDQIAALPNPAEVSA